jgi:hypothetical protein
MRLADERMDGLLDPNLAVNRNVLDNVRQRILGEPS